MKPLLSKSLPVMLAVALAGLPTLPVQAQALPSNKVDSIVAVVNEDVILRSELELSIANVTSQFKQQHGGELPPRDVFERQVLERLILVRLQVARANDSGIRITDDELQQAVGQVAQQNQLSVDQLRQRLGADGLSFSEFQDNLRDEITVQRFRQRYVQSAVQISEAEIDQVVATQQVGGPEVRVANLVISLNDGATPDEISAAKAKIDDIRNQIQGGKIDFRSAAIRYSQAQNALDGGEIGWRSLDTLPPAFADIMRSLKPGEMTQVIRSGNGFQFVMLEETRDAQPQKVTQFHAQDIMVATSDVVGVEQARQKAEALHARVVAGEDFGKVAKEGSDDTQTRGNGGDMGWFPADGWGSAIRDQIQKLSDGEVSPVFQSDVGFHFIKRLAVRDQDVTSENQRNKAREIIGQRKSDEVYERFLRQLRNEAYVETRLAPAGT